MIKGVFSLIGTDSTNLKVLEILAKISKRNSKSRPALGKAREALAAEANAAERTFILDLTAALIETLNAGIIISNNKNLCCPDCKRGVYFLGSAENFIILNESSVTFCCLEHLSSVETWLTVLESLGGTDIPCCHTDFNEAVQQWIESSSSSSANFYLDDLIDLGILESSSFNGYSGLGILFNYLQLTHPELTDEDYLNILGVIVNLGIVIQCNGCEMIISSTETYLKWAEATGGGGGPLPV
jgi:hypothetical protein